MKIGIIGAGNIGSAIALGLAASPKIDNSHIYISNPSSEKLQKFSALGMHTFISNIAVVQHADIIFLAVKPWLIATVAAEIALELDNSRQIVVSTAAGVNLEELSAMFAYNDTTPPLLRMIPNTAIAIGEGVLTLSHGNVSDYIVKCVTDLLALLGEVIVVPEKQLNALMSLSSCGIAYAFRYIRAAVEGAVEMGIAPKTAQNVVLQTLIGAAELLRTNQSHPEQEIDKVTTPGGITIRGLNEMEANGFSNAVIKGLKASHLK